MRSPTNEDQLRRLTSAVHNTPPSAREALASVLNELLRSPGLHGRLLEEVAGSLEGDDLEANEAVAEADDLLNVPTQARPRARARGRTRYRVEDRDVRVRGKQ